MEIRGGLLLVVRSSGLRDVRSVDKFRYLLYRDRNNAEADNKREAGWRREMDKGTKK